MPNRNRACKQPESEVVEYKTSLAEKETAGRDLCAFANKDGGILYFGVDNDGKVLGVGSVSEKTVRNLSNMYVDNTEPRIYPQVTTELETGVTLIKVVVSRSDTPHHTYKGIPYIRVGPASTKMSQKEYQKRLVKYEGANQDYSSRIVAGATINDVSPLALGELRRLLTQSGRFQQDAENISDARLLSNLRLIQDNGLTLAALVLLGKERSLSKLLPFSEIRFGYKISEDEPRNQDTVIYRGGYLLYYNKLWEKIDSRNVTLHIPFGMLLLERKAFEEETIREAVNNSVIHRDYSERESVFIIQYPKTIEVRSPGGFVEGVTLENILEASKPRNKLIADILFRCELVEQFGSGIDLMFRKQLSLGKPPPDYEKTDDRHVILNLSGAIQDVEFARYVLRAAEEKQLYPSDRELLLLYRIKNNERVKSNIITRKLLELGLIEKRGYGRWILSKKYYSDTEQRGKYTRQKGLSKERNKELILQHLREFPEGSKKPELLEVFNYELSWGQVWRLLDELRDDGEVFFDGKRRSPKGFWKVTNGIEIK